MDVINIYFRNPDRPLTYLPDIRWVQRRTVTELRASGWNTFLASPIDLGTKDVTHYYEKEITAKR